MDREFPVEIDPVEPLPYQKGLNAARGKPAAGPVAERDIGVLRRGIPAADGHDETQAWMRLSQHPQSRERAALSRGRLNTHPGVIRLAESIDQIVDLPGGNLRYRHAAIVVRGDLRRRFGTNR